MCSSLYIVCTGHCSIYLSVHLLSTSPNSADGCSDERSNSFIFMSYYFHPGTALAAVCINISVENFAGWKYSLTFNIIQTSYFAGFLVYLSINLALVLSSVYIITHFAPAAAGSGIPEIKGYLNGNCSYI